MTIKKSTNNTSSFDVKQLAMVLSSSMAWRRVLRIILDSAARELQKPDGGDHRRVAMALLRVQEELKRRERIESSLSHDLYQFVLRAKAFEHLVDIDHVTELLNHRGFVRAFDMIDLTAHPRRRAGEYKTFALLFLDIRKFKRINRMLGHQQGTLVIGKVAQVIASTIRADILARYGGDEFVAVLANVSNAEHVRKMAERVVRAVLRHKWPFEWRRAGVAIDASTFVIEARGVPREMTQSEIKDHILNEASLVMQEGKYKKNRNNHGGVVCRNGIIDENGFRLLDEDHHAHTSAK